MPDRPATEDEFGAEDRKLVTLARATRARTRALHGAAVRDTTGRTYTAATVALPSFTVSALRLAVAMAASSGAEGIEAAALLTDEPDAGVAEGRAVSDEDLAAVRDLGGRGVPVLVADPAGVVRATLAT